MHFFVYVILSLGLKVDICTLVNQLLLFKSNLLPYPFKQKTAMPSYISSHCTTVACTVLSFDNKIITRDALRGHTMSKNGSISSFFFFFCSS